MEITLFALAAIAYVVMVAIADIEPYRSRLSHFELKRRQQKKDNDVAIHTLREAYYVDMIAWRRTVVGVLAALAILLMVASVGWVLGVLAVVAGVLMRGAITRLSRAGKWGQSLYDKWETRLLGYAERWGAYTAFLRGPIKERGSTDVSIDSREELLHLIKRSGRVLSTEERKLIEAGLSFTKATVAGLMTPRSSISSVDKNELLGPLTIDELHKTGFSRFPVIDGDIDHIIGILHLRDLVSLQDKKSAKARAAMKTPVYYIKETQTLQQALATFLTTGSSLLIVVNEQQETVGIITLESVLETLLGRKIVDEHEAHENLRTVAARE